MSNTKALITTGDVAALIESIAPSQEALAQQNQVITRTKTITLVTNDAEEKNAVEVAAVAKGFLSKIEADRKTVKAPFLDAGTKIDIVARSIANAVQAEYNRVTALISGRRAQVQREIEAERAKLRAEQQRIEDERRRLEQEKAALARREEEARKAAEVARTAAQKKKAAAALAEIDDKKLDHEFAVANNQELSQVASTTVIDERAMQGAAVRQDFEIEVTDPVEFFGMFPQFCDIVVKKNPLKEWLKTQWDGKQQIPGVIITPKLTTAVRGVSPNLTLKS